MKKLIGIFLIITTSVNVSAATYYFSSTDGNDSRTSAQAQNSSSPWKSIEKLNSFFSSLQPGDEVLFKKGDVFYGSIIINKSGSTESPIILSSYGSVMKPVITGFTNITSWNKLGNNLWESPSYGSDLSACNIVVIDGINTAMGRTPNSSTFAITSNRGNTIECSSLTGKTDYTGAEVVVRTTSSWIMGKMNVQVVNQAGAIVHAYEFNKDQIVNQITVPAHDLPTGVYFIHVQIGTWSEKSKIVKL